MIAITRPEDAVSEVTWTAPALSAARLWRALCEAFGSARTDDAKLIVEGLPADESPDPALEPVTWLKTLGFEHEPLAYAREVQRHDRVLFEALVVMLSPLMAQAGLPGGPVEIEVFCGNYRSTPGGIHRETCSNLHLVVTGTKSMHFWLDADWPPHGTVMRTDVAPESGGREDYLPEADPAGLIDSARTLTASSGHGFAWQAEAWHVGETHGPSLALNIAAYEKTCRLPLWAERLHGEVPSDWLVAYRRHSGSRDPLAWLSGLGIRPAPPRRPPTAAPELALRRPAVPVLWRADDGNLEVATMGAATRVPDTTAARDWLAGPWTDVPRPVRDLAGWLCWQGALEPLEER